MLNVEDIDINNKEAIEFLRTALVQILEKQREYQIEWERRNKANIERMKEDLQKIQSPEDEATKQTIFNNIIFFIGSLVAPEITPSNLFGKEKVSEERQEYYNLLRSECQKFITIFGEKADANVETILAINKALSAISVNDEALIRLYVELNNEYENKKDDIYRFKLSDSMYQCEYYNPETYDKIRKFISVGKSNIESIINFINQYNATYGNAIKEKGR